MRGLISLLLAISCFGSESRIIPASPALGFEARGSTYLAHGSGFDLSITSAAAVLHVRGQAIRMLLVGANPGSTIEALDRMPGRANYMLGPDVRRSYGLYSRVRTRAVYPGTDIVFRGNQDRFEYDFEIAAGRAPQAIQIAFEGVDAIALDKNGDLLLRRGEIHIRQPKPSAYQVLAGHRQPVDVNFRIDAFRHVGFQVGQYDRTHALVIDPQIVFEKMFGGSAMATATALARDGQGNLYVIGTTNSADFPTVAAFQSKLGSVPLAESSDGGQTWSPPAVGSARSIGVLAAAPSDASVIYGAAPDSVLKSTDSGNSFVPTASTGLDGPVYMLAVDASVATTVYAATGDKFFVSTDGGETWQPSTQGITGNLPIMIAADPSQGGVVYAGVQAQQTFFRSTDFGQTWSPILLTEFGLSAVPRAMAFGTNGVIVVGTDLGLFTSADRGNTWTPASTQVIFNNQSLVFSPSGTLYMVNPSGVQSSTDNGQTFKPLLPGVQFTQQARIAIDPNNPDELYITDKNVLYRSTDAGQTWSQLPLPFYASPQTILSAAPSKLFLGIAVQSTGFLTKLSPDGSQILYSTYFGGSGNDNPTGIAVDASRNVYIAGFTSSPDFPTTPGAFQNKLSHAPEVFVSKFSPDGSKLIYSTLVGSEADFGLPVSVAVDAGGNAVIAGTTSGDFPTTSSAQPTVRPQGCGVGPPYVPLGPAFATKIAPDGKALVYSILIGGACATYGSGVALDPSGNVWIAGSTVGSDLLATSDALQTNYGGGLSDGFLARVNSSGSIDYLTYIGGPGYDAVNAIAIDSSGAIYLSGESGGLSQPASAGAFQAQANASCRYFSPGPGGAFQVEGNALVLKLDPKAHSVQRLTYLGAPGCLAGSAIGIDPQGEPWIAGSTNQALLTFPTVSPVQIGGAGFISKFSADFTKLLFSSYFDSISGLVLDPSGAAFVAGTTALSRPFFSPISQSAYLAKIDSSPSPSIAVGSIDSVDPVVNPSNFQGIAPGEVIQILGQNLGPATPTPGVIQSGFLQTSVAGVQVTFDGVAVPLLSVSAQQIELVAPFELTGKTRTVVQVQYNGAKSNPVQVVVSGSALQILGVFNQDFTPNSASNPAKPGSIMTLYLAGVGQTDPPSADGQINAAPLPLLPVPFTIQWFGLGSLSTLSATFAGAAPQTAAGIFQINFVAPPQTLMNITLQLQQSVPNGGTIYGQFNAFVQQ
ncbi:MAG TPA: SBBP repeat-containing protein [Bryobacteraceae bacterium]|nr:SBBP repeat-containing protein [Bryobacteraceae bacterium]